MYYSTINTVVRPLHPALGDAADDGTPERPRTTANETFDPNSNCD